jgi:hydroxypyruvate isomerase
MRRRELLQMGSMAALGSLVLDVPGAVTTNKIVKNGRLKQSVSRWCYGKIPLEEFCRSVADMGLTAIDLLTEDEWGIAAKYGLICSMGFNTSTGPTIPEGFNNPDNHDRLVKWYQKTLPLAKKARVPNLIAFFGNRNNMSDQAALENSIKGFNQIKKMAEDHDITICIELLNSKVDHKDYLGDRTSFGLQIVKAVNSPRLKLLYDIYHMQIMEGDVIRTIRDNQQYIAHYHTGGVPGRHELDETQELNWKAICRAIVETGFKGYLAHEFVPVRTPLQSLREAVEICDV